MGEEFRAYRVLVGKPERRDHLENVGLVSKIIFKWILNMGWRGLVSSSS